MQKIVYGTISLILCCVFYLVWWILAFRPDGKKGATWFWLLPTAAFAVAGILLSVEGINAEKPGKPMLGMLPVPAGIAVYLVLLAVTSLAMHRQVTTELLLIVGWTVLNVCMLDTAACFDTWGGIPQTTAIVFMVLSLVTMCVSMAAYLKYYDLPVKAGYIDGMIPLILVGAQMGLQLFFYRK
ncbi:MAG: hypothetical protein LKJ76_01610 [Lachnospiraceae bacterium]|nr:hypothetical protein [Lachnospiraceae bacterium]